MTNLFLKKTTEKFPYVQKLRNTFINNLSVKKQIIWKLEHTLNRTIMKILCMNICDATKAERGKCTALIYERRKEAEK